MSETAVDTATLTNELAHFTGTAQWYRHPLMPSVTYTDGVKHFAERAGAYWMLDIFATELPTVVMDPAQGDGFLSIKAHVADGQARLVADDGNKRVLWQRVIEWTDCPPSPEDGWQFLMETGGPGDTIVILLPREH